MKKIFLLAAAALVALTACTKIDDVTSTPDVKIGYQVANYMNQTKANDGSFIDELTSLGVTSGQAFKSIAYINADNGSGGTNLRTFFANNPETISWDATNKIWAPSIDYYWPKSPNSNLDFFSWYDFENGTAPTLTYNGTAASLVWSNRTVAGKSDILFADVAWHQTANTTPATYGGYGVSEGVPTLFHHALAQVRFTVKIKDNCDKKEDVRHSGNYTFWEVTLSGVKITDNTVHENGTLTLNINDPDANDKAASITAWAAPTVWTNASSPAYVATGTQWFTTDVATGAAPVTTTLAYLTPATFMPDNFIAVRPQAVTDAMNLVFTVTIHTYYGTTAQFEATGHTGCTDLGTETFNVSAFATEVTTDAYTDNGLQLNKMASAPQSWAMNTKTTYNIVIDPSTSTILFDPAVEAWSAETSVNVPVPAE